MAKSGKPMAIRRCCGIDRGGVLYIGRSTSLRTRIGTLKRMICPGEEKPARSGHIFGLTYRRCRKFKDRYPPDRLMFVFRHCHEPAPAEIRLLGRYLKSFGELPPGNANLPKPVVEAVAKRAARGQ
jgi:hypothetical protein